MCQIQLTKRFGNKLLSKKDIEGFTNLLYFGSMRNDDAHGVLTENGVILKSNKKLDFQEVFDALKNTECNIMIGHNRYKTQGSAEIMENNHPFDTQNFIVVHNGVLRNDAKLKEQYKLDYNVETDSYIISALLEYFYTQLNNEEQAIKLVAESIAGSFSVMIYCKNSKRLFYFKEKNTDFCFGLIKDNKAWDLLVASTDKDNIVTAFSDTLRGVFSIPIDYTLYEPEPHKIYEITDNDISIIDTFKEATYTYYDKSEWCVASSDTKTLKNSKDKNYIGLKTIFKDIGNEIEESLKQYSLKIKTRGYNYHDLTITFNIKGLLSTQDRIWLEEEFVSYGTLRFEQKDDNTKIIFELDSETVKDIMTKTFVESENKNIEAVSSAYYNDYYGRNAW